MEYHGNIENDKDTMRLGSMVFKVGGGKNAVLVCPTLWAFLGGLDQMLERIEKHNGTSSGELDALFNTVLDDLIAEMLIYLENRLRILKIQDDVGKMNSISEAIKLYSKASIDLGKLCDIGYLKQVDILRGKKHHTAERYALHEIGNGKYVNLEYIKQTVESVRAAIKELDKALFAQYPDFEVTVAKTEENFTIAFNAVKHAFDMTKNGKLVPKNPSLTSTGMPHPSNISFFQIQANFKKPTA